MTDLKNLRHRLTIDDARCRGHLICHACEAIAPGLVMECRQYGEIIIQPWASREMSPRISRLIAECPDRAIVVTPLPPPV